MLDFDFVIIIIIVTVHRAIIITRIGIQLLVLMVTFGSRFAVFWLAIAVAFRDRPFESLHHLRARNTHKVNGGDAGERKMWDASIAQIT